MLAAGFTNDSVMPGTFTLVQLMAVDASKWSRRYAWVTDLFGGGVPDWCISDGQQWKPVRPYGLQSAAVSATASMVLTPMANAPTQIVTGALALGSTLTVTFSNTYAYKGAPFRVSRKITGLGSVLVGPLATALGLSSWMDHEFDGSTWVQTASGGLL